MHPLPEMKNDKPFVLMTYIDISVIVKRQVKGPFTLNKLQLVIANEKRTRAAVSLRASRNARTEDGRNTRTSFCAHTGNRKKHPLHSPSVDFLQYCLCTVRR